MMNNVSDRTVKVWDPLVRLFHWTLVVAFFIAYVTEDDWMSVHEFAGYLVLGLVAFRIIWGFIGPRHARFSDFVVPPSAVKAYLQQASRFQAPRYLGHNPAGGAMILALLAMLTLTSLSGVLLENGGGWLEEVHEFFANLTLLLVALHVAGVIFSSIEHGENLARAMFTGRKRA